MGSRNGKDDGRGKNNSRRKRVTEIPPLPLSSEQDLVRHIRAVSDSVRRNIHLDTAGLVLRGVRAGIRALEQQPNAEQLKADIITLPPFSLLLNMLFTDPFINSKGPHCLTENILNTVCTMANANPTLILNDPPFTQISQIASRHGAGIHESVQRMAHGMMLDWQAKRTASIAAWIAITTAPCPLRSMDRNAEGRRDGIAVSKVYDFGQQ